VFLGVLYESLAHPLPYLVPAAGGLGALLALRSPTSATVMPSSAYTLFGIVQKYGYDRGLRTRRRAAARPDLGDAIFEATWRASADPDDHHAALLAAGLRCGATGPGTELRRPHGITMSAA